jgi:threonine aldolase
MQKMRKQGFASDNNAGVHPEVIEAIIRANEGHAIAYGEDEYTAASKELFYKEFGRDIDIYFVFNGTGANVVSLMSVTQSFHSVICAETAHIQVDECGAPEKIAACKLITVPTSDGKLTPELLAPYLHGFDFEHHTQPRVISISQVTELGTVYKPQEITDIAQCAHKHGMLLHVDGARVANAAATLGLTFKQITLDCGVDVLSFGGTKNGMMYGEAVLFFNKSLSLYTKYYRKQATQLASKMRFISAQFNAYLSNNLWLHNAKHANQMAQYLIAQLADIKQITITQAVEANAVFAIIPQKLIKPLQQEYFFYVWNEQKNEVRWMCSFDTSKEDIDLFVAALRKLL